jgi:hypothetical protein
MATGRTVRQVKQGERLRRSQNSLNPLSGPESDIEQNEGIARVVKTSEFGRCGGVSSVERLTRW